MTRSALALLFAVLGVPGAVVAQLPEGAPARPSASPPAPLTRDDVERFADSAFASYVRRSEAPSLAVIVVHGESVLFAKGYGVESEQTRRPVNPDSTLFNIASVSKLITATAAMQMVERGSLGLDERVSRRLRAFDLANGAGGAVTLRHLLTHTSGLDGPFMRAVVADPRDIVPLGQYFAAHPLTPGRAAGREIRYSNEGMALAGHLVELASGEPFDQYAERHIFEPLGMRHSTFRQPPPPALAERVATAGSGPVPDALLPYPAGSAVSTASDMGRFMLAHLNGGRAGNVRILADSTVRRMHARQWRADPRQPGVALGFFESDLGDEPGLFHTGARTHFSLLYLLPERGVGIFIVQSMRQGGEWQSLRTDVVRGFIERYFPHGAPGLARPDTTGAAARAARYAGVYRPVLLASTTIERAAWLGLDTRVRSARDGSLDFALPGGTRLHLEEVGDALYRVPAGSSAGLTVSFAPRGSSKVSRMAMSGSTQDPVSFDRLAWYERGALHAGLLGACMLLLASAPLVAGGRALARLVRRACHGPAPGTERKDGVGRAAWRIAALAGGLAILAPVATLGMVLTHAGEDTAANGLRAALTVGLSALLAAIIAGLALAPLVARAWRRAAWTRGQRIYLAALAGAALVAAPLLAYYHLLGFWF
ncbi:MAG: serine hydrolase domain-containing protein [Gemmatimonadaceae bacterium]